MKALFSRPGTSAVADKAETAKKPTIAIFPTIFNQRSPPKPETAAAPKMGRGRNVQTTPEQPRGLLGIIKTPGRKTTSPELEAAKTKAKTVTRKDAQLLCEARNLKKGERLSPEQADALARRARGTARDYWKDWVDVQGKYTDKGYVAEGVSNTAGPVAVAGSLVVLGLIAFIALEFA